MREIRLPLPTYAYNFDLLLEFVKRIAYPARMVVRGDTLWRFTAGQLLSYRHVSGAILVRGESLSPENEEIIREASLRWLGLCRDLPSFYEFARTDARLWRVIEPLHGLPVFCTETVFEALVTLIIEQHITWKTTLRSQRTLMQTMDCAECTHETGVYDFPSPQQLAAASLDELKALKITNRRITLIIEIAKSVSRGEFDPESILHLDPRAAYDKLKTIKGVGHWTAGNVVGRARGDYPYISDNDVALQAAVQQYFYAGEGVKSAAQVVETLSEYGEYAGLVGHFVLMRLVLDRYPPTSH